MAAGQKHLHELLKEDQEPFRLENYLDDKRCQLKRSNHLKTTSLQVKKRKPSITAETSTIEVAAKRSLFKHACLFSFNDSPDVRKSPFLNFPSPAKSPCRNQNGSVFLHVPARTSALLLEAAMRIQKQQTSSSLAKPKSQIKNMGFGLFSSIIKRLKDRNRNRKCEIRDAKFQISRRSSAKTEENVAAVGRNNEGGFSYSCNNNRLSSAGWSKSNEEKSLDMQTSTSGCRSDELDEMDFVAQESLDEACVSCENLFCSTPVSPFTFSLQRTPSFGRRTPVFSSPATSPSRQNDQDKKGYEGSDFENSKLEGDEEKEQCSPVSVLDPRFEDEDKEDGGNEENEQDYDLECGFAVVQRAKEQLLYKLQRFEKLAELDPIELEKRMMEQLDDEDDNEDQIEEDNEYLLPLNRGCGLDLAVSEVCGESCLENRKEVPVVMKRLVSDLIWEEKRENKEIVVGRVCNKLDSWKEVESNTIDMMVELDFRSEFGQWKRFQEQKEETAIEIELAIFHLLVEELSEVPL